MTDSTPNEELREYAEFDDGVIRLEVDDLTGTIAIPATPTHELRELVELWKREHERRKHGDVEMKAWGVAHDNCADDLEELIGDE